ncbi:MAG: iron-sulfur cluster assembly accessory protein [Bacteroidetes bacterium]|nr:iron-sulfur cluster assembly accessory protein [Bacteroidota bacterium]MCH8523613.1 iron-sulfur cluster assembly accessory protein [Balneolales bacterium]
MISISARAQNRIKQIRSEQGITHNTYLRVGVVSGGCSGLSYELDFDRDFDPSTAGEDQKLFEVDDTLLVIDMRSFLYLAGTELDYTDGLQGEGFHFKNPNASRTCSCGESFSV